jgi:hypothetical protein
MADIMPMVRSIMKRNPQFSCWNWVNYNNKKSIRIFYMAST